MTHADTPDEPPEPARIRQLRRLVTALTMVMMVGMVVVVGLLVWRLTGMGSTATPLPAEIALPDGERLTGFARNPQWIVLITDTADGQRLHLAAPDGSIRQSVEITATPD